MKTETKECKICNVPKPIEEFYPLGEETERRHPYCKSCPIAYTTAHKKDKILVPYNKIGVVLEQKGWSQRKLCLMLGMSKPRVNSYVHNKYQPPFSVLFQIAQGLGVKPSELINDEL